MVKGKVKYKSAYDENHNLVTLTPGYKVNGKFTCPNHYCKGKDPKTCPYFKPDESIINRRICAFEDFKRKYPVDIYIKQK